MIMAHRCDGTQDDTDATDDHRLIFIIKEKTRNLWSSVASVSSVCHHVTVVSEYGRCRFVVFFAQTHQVLAVLVLHHRACHFAQFVGRNPPLAVSNAL